MKLKRMIEDQNLGPLTPEECLDGALHCPRPSEWVGVYSVDHQRKINPIALLPRIEKSIPLMALLKHRTQYGIVIITGDQVFSYFAADTYTRAEWETAMMELDEDIEKIFTPRS